MQVDERSSPNYFRWQHERSPYIIELNEEMADRLLPEIQAAHRAGQEAGGLLIGSFPKAKNLTLRIDDYLLISFPETTAGQYELSAEQRAVLSTTRHRLIEQQTPVLGFFRSDLRNRQDGSALLLSAEDRSFLKLEFRRAIHVALLISASEPHTAAFFVPDLNGSVEPGPPLSTFRFGTDIAHLAVPTPQTPIASSVKVPHEAAVDAEAAKPALRPVAVKQRSVNWNGSWLWGLAAGLITVCLFLTVWAPTIMRLFAKDQALRLSVTSRSHVLELRWNRLQPNLLHASSAILTIADGGTPRQWTLSPLEMRLGSVAYRQHSGQVDFTLRLRLPDSMELVQSATWRSSQPTPP